MQLSAQTTAPSSAVTAHDARRQPSFVASRPAAPSTACLQPTCSRRNAASAAAARARRLVVQAGGGFGKPIERKLSKQKACPCGSGAAYVDCCQPYHDGTLPGTPEELMRSRYSAYVKGRWQYVCDTTHPLNPLLTDEAAQAGKPTLKDDVLATIDKLAFEKLKVLSTEAGEDESEGYVTFQEGAGEAWAPLAMPGCRAWFKTRDQLGQRAQGFHTQTFVERSRFLKEAGKWLYVDGEQDWEAKK
ncbi:hypothetical protein D9Q98_003453 [Chlorella vulgaris]|uniref:YchJ-like middle NTF2-like domain-containing protein n=1 Tax=Chlorella vulgaris TaxID=3077 RepID=A0A9D4TT37_CHLVU|nr:hypothetical protein D9Q98_003453 [Chlorella vulgaris]